MEKDGDSRTERDALLIGLQASKVSIKGMQSLPMAQRFLRKRIHSINIALSTYYVPGTLLFRNPLSILANV